MAFGFFVVFVVALEDPVSFTADKVPGTQTDYSESNVNEPSREGRDYDGNIRYGGRDIFQSDADVKEEPVQEDLDVAEYRQRANTGTGFAYAMRPVG